LGEEVVGRSYRSAIFYTSQEPRMVAEEAIRDFDASSHWPGRVVTQVCEARRFWEAEANDQDYFHR
ncbi:MAG: peptide-methionine (S)-S-oxide reductase, partial [Chloroflexi bacterium]|nr:peptide-methionine (S)-S-oxide reductase [Chloroflexota bacterium]